MEFSFSLPEPLNKLLNPSAEEGGAYLLRRFKAHLASKGIERQAEADIIFAYAAFDWSSRGGDFWNYLRSKVSGLTEQTEVDLLQSLINDLVDQNSIYALFSGRPIYYEDGEKVVPDLKRMQIVAVQKPVWYVTKKVYKLTLPLWAFLIFLVYLGSEEFKNPATAYVSIAIGGFFINSFLISYGSPNKGSSAVMIKLTNLGQKFYLEKIMPNLALYLREKNL